MHFPTGSLHPTFVASAQKLREKLQAEGPLPRHSEILKRVAESFGVSSWSKLFADKWCASFNEYFTPGDDSKYPTLGLAIEDVLYSTAAPDKVFFGGRERAVHQPYMPNYGMQHTILVGDTEPGCQELIEFLLLQNMVRGGGCLYLDTVTQDTSYYRVKEFAAYTRVPYRKLDRVEVVREVSPIKSLVENGEVGYLALDFLTDEIESQIYLDQIMANLKQVVGNHIPKYPRTPPFFVVVPDAQRLSAEGLGLLLRRAEAANVTFIFTVASLEAVSLSSKSLLDALLQYTAHKVFFAHANPYAARAAADLLHAYPYVDRPLLQLRKSALEKVLVHPWLHETLLLSKQQLYRVSVPYLYTRDWDARPRYVLD